MDKVCKKCEIFKPFSEFVKNKNCKDGHEGTCKKCKNSIRLARYEEKYKQSYPSCDGLKKCTRCQKTKNVNEYNVDLKCVGGRRTVCKICDNERIRERSKLNKKEKNSIYWNRYADSMNWRAGQCTITGKELELLYEKEGHCCAYCAVELNEIFHAEHKIPLSQNGLHLIENIVFSCPDCNRLKFMRTHIEFMDFVKIYAKRFI